MESGSYPDAPDWVMRVKDARIAYGKTQALRGVSLELRSGEILGLLGPNGAGKTSLLQCIAGQIQLDDGDIEFGIHGDRKQIVGIVPQELAIYPDLSVSQNLFAFGRFCGLTGRQLRSAVAQALEWAQLHDKSRSLARTLSGGMQRRLNIACSVLHRPRILLLDEPTVGVDPQSRERIYDMLASLLDEGAAILLTTHHLEEAQDRCDRIAIIDQGQILDCGSFDQLVDRSIGSAQHVCVRFIGPVRRLPKPLVLGPSGREATAEITDITQELPRLLAALSMRHLQVEHLSIRGPSLQHMFLHLTGKELRE